MGGDLQLNPIILFLVQNDELCIQTNGICQSIISGIFTNCAKENLQELVAEAKDDITQAIEHLDSITSEPPSTVSESLRNTLAANIVLENKGQISSSTAIDAAMQNEAEEAEILRRTLSPIASQALLELPALVKTQVFSGADDLDFPGLSSVKFVFILAHGADNQSIGGVCPSVWKEKLKALTPKPIAVDVIACISAQTSIFSWFRSSISRMQVDRVPIRGRLRCFDVMHPLTSICTSVIYIIANHHFITLPGQSIERNAGLALFKYTAVACQMDRQIGRSVELIVIE